MPKLSSYGKIAARVLKDGDVDVSTGSRSRESVMEALRELEIIDTKQKVEVSVDRISSHIKFVEKWASRREMRRREINASRSDQIAASQAWRDAGVRSKFVLVETPLPLRIACWLAFAGIDVYLFGVAMCNALNKDPYSADGVLGLSGAFWTGGGFGLMVFILGLVLARTLRQVDYSNAQKVLIQELEELGMLPEGLHADAAGGRSSLISSLLFGALIIITFIVRLQGDAIDIFTDFSEIARAAPIALQALVPPVSVCVEAVMHDPTEIRIRKPGALDGYLEWRRLGLDRKVELRKVEISRSEERVVARYRVERAVLEVLHESRGVSTKDGRTS